VRSTEQDDLRKIMHDQHFGYVWHRALNFLMLLCLKRFFDTQNSIQNQIAGSRNSDAACQGDSTRQLKGRASNEVYLNRKLASHGNNLKSEAPPCETQCSAPFLNPATRNLYPNAEHSAAHGAP
jgi:hypothetical protein